jgi:predicted TIM-barrel fold metal-dependent hydrolase
MMQGAEIDRAVISYPTSDAHLKLGGSEKLARIYNDSVGKIINRYPGIFIGAAVLPLGNGTPEILDELKRATQELGFKAISLPSSFNSVYLDDKSFYLIYKYACEKNLPVFVHSQIINPIGYERLQDPLLTPVIEYVFDTTVCVGKLLMSGILRDVPQLKFIFACFGGVVAHLAHRFDATYEMLRGINFVKDLGAKPTDFLKNIYVDTGGDINKTNFLAALELLGPRHILWGSDWPAKKDAAGSISAVRNLEIAQGDKEAILGGNLAAML